MSDPIKKQILDAIKTAVDTVAGAGTVYIDPSRGLVESQPMPYTNIFTSGESSKKTSLFRESYFDIEIHTFVKADTDNAARDACITVLADLQKALLPIGSGNRSLCIYFEEQEGDAADILFIEEALCIAIARYRVGYRTAYGNPYSQQP